MCHENRIIARKVHNMWPIDISDFMKFAKNCNEPRRGKRKGLSCEVVLWRLLLWVL